MLGDFILDRKEGVIRQDYGKYRPQILIDWLDDDYIDIWPRRELLELMKRGDEEGVKKCLCNYIIKDGWDPKICDYINSVLWTRARWKQKEKPPKKKKESEIKTEYVTNPLF